jgi:hypothetical protein
MTDLTPTPEALELVPGTPEYDAAMIAKVDAANGIKQETPAATERPAWLPEKFASAEDMAAAYAELEKKQSTPAAAGEPQSETQVVAEAAVTEAGLDLDTLATKYMADGDLAAEDYEALSKVGISKTMVDAYIAGQQALASQYESDMYASVGGAEAYTETVEWAAASLNPAEIKAFNTIVDSGDLNAVKMAIGGLRARFEAANGATPTLLSGTTPADTGTVYRSLAEMKADMRDPRYAKDEAFRAEVSSKLSRSNIM